MTRTLIAISLLGLFLSMSCSKEAADSKEVSPPRLGPFQSSPYSIHFSKTGVSVEVQFFTSDEPGAPDMTCPEEIVDRAMTCRFPDYPIVFDAGHSYTPKSNRSDLETADDPFSESLKGHDDLFPASGYMKPEFSDVTKVSQREPEEDQPARYSKPETHEGNFNMANTLMTKYFLDRCLIAKMPGFGESRSPIALTRHPGEVYFGEFNNPNWVEESAPAKISDRQISMPILAELKFESLMNLPSSARINPSLGGTLISRNAYINYLLGSQKPWAFRLASMEEENSQTLSPAAYSVFNLRPGMAVSFHSDTAPVGIPEEPEKKSRFLTKYRDVRKRYLAVKGDAAKVFKLRDEWQNFFYHELGLRSKDVSTLFIPTMAMPSSPPLNKDFLQGPPASAPAFEPFFVKDMRDGLNAYLMPWKPLKDNGGKVVIAKNPIHLALLAGAVQTRNKLLVESIQLTGHAAGEMIRQVRRGDRRLEARVTGPSGSRSVSLNYSDAQILSAKGQAAGLAKALCR